MSQEEPEAGDCDRSDRPPVRHVRVAARGAVTLEDQAMERRHAGPELVIRRAGEADRRETGHGRDVRRRHDPADHDRSDRTSPTTSSITPRTTGSRESLTSRSTIGTTRATSSRLRAWCGLSSYTQNSTTPIS